MKCLLLKCICRHYKNRNKHLLSSDCIDMVATSKVLYDGTSALNEVSDTFSLACGCK